MTPVIRKKRIGPVILTAGLRRDGRHSWSVADDHRDGGPVIVAITTPWVIVAIFDGPRLEAYADSLDDDDCSGEEGEAFDTETGTWVPVTFS